MDLDDLLKEYWPIFVGVVVVLLTAIVVWPSQKPAQTDPSLQPVVISPFTPEVERALAQKQEKEPQPERDSGAPSSSDELDSPPAEYQILEIVEAIPVAERAADLRKFQTDDPEVQRALGKLEVTIYQEQECSSCLTALAYLEQNGVSVTARNVEEDSNQRERARRLSGGRALPVLVVDGKVVQGLSESALQAALTSAVKSRVEAEFQAKSGL